MIYGICVFCGRPARITCSMCGKSMCENCYDFRVGLCRFCTKKLR